MEMKTGCRKGVEAEGGPETACVCVGHDRTLAVGSAAVSVRVDVRKV